ncbi:hypothetical protein ACFLR5_01810 [Elusimicrobiota bacterium]
MLKGPAGVKLSFAADHTSKVEWEDSWGIEHELDTYTLLDMQVSIPVSVCDINVGCRNILDQKYQTRENYPLPGRIMYGGLMVKF